MKIKTKIIIIGAIVLSFATGAYAENEFKSTKELSIEQLNKAYNSGNTLKTTAYATTSSAMSNQLILQEIEETNRILRCIDYKLSKKYQLTGE